MIVLVKSIPVYETIEKAKWLTEESSVQCLPIKSKENSLLRPNTSVHPLVVLKDISQIGRKMP